MLGPRSQAAKTSNPMNRMRKHSVDLGEQRFDVIEGESVHNTFLKNQIERAQDTIVLPQLLAVNL